MKAVIFGWKREYLSTYLEDCEKISEKLCNDGYDIYTGAGSGFMNKGNLGCYKVNKNKSFGVTVKCLLNKEGPNNNILNENLEVTDNFATRKEKLINNYNLMIFFPGGMGTLDEFTEVMNLIKTGELELNTIILYGYKYWNSLITWFEFNNIKFPNHLIDGIADNVDEFMEIYKQKKNDSLQESLVESNVTNEEIKSYEPIFNKKNIFNPLDEIDDLINIMFSNPDVLEKINFTDIAKNNKIDLLNDNTEGSNSESYDDDFEIEEDENGDFIIEIVYDESSDDNIDDDDNNIPLDPIDFITDSDSDSEK